MEEAPHSTAARDWNRRVVRLALPIILANLALPILAMVDTTVAGHLSGPQHLGGVALGGILFSFLFWSFGFLRMATTGLAAQAYGANDHVELRKHLLRALLIATVSGVVIVCLQWPIISAGITLMGGSGAVQHSAADYAYARIWSSPASLGNFVVLGYLLGSQRVSLALVLQIGMNILNLAATLFLAIGLDWGVAGIGAGTAVAEWAIFLTALLFVKPFKGMNPAIVGAILDRAAFARLFRVNIDIFLRSFFLLVSFGWFTRAGAAEGDVVLAANAVLMNLHSFMAYGLDGFAHATETLVGSAIGSKDRTALRGVIRAAAIWSLAVALLFSLSYWLAGDAIVSLLTDQQAIRETAARFLPYVVILPIASFAGFLLDGVFIGALRTRELRNSMFLSTVVFLAVACLLQASLGNHGLWIAMIAFMLFRAGALGSYLGRILRA
ncbi:MATE family efflux transporter [Mesorhizobium sp.]|uniref:MATE family efflux transporter n=1 Tax=Mesorhizobium sp. TaxID=1871066 RepID=UPI000FE5458E|nr:MATE family efflux transporter [Mesorhizobium sp.]RWK42133.1 MAG: MATE family efflux transporter [Mesorhizobium sp.]RWK70099.1 MAG: MATE family efflux transporter [Mesorhizobium sp.]RWK74926.1 MAG: MATE family efflux transporter [Mesorhizobium sp.]RWK80041.1 MAG: MATE family efflux transporter [Mesorhizobium sp.]RWL07702.1 MAG: MATE family efflux transporter [Mesorhizobium sp.]